MQDSAITRGVQSNLLGNAILAQWIDTKPVDYVVITEVTIKLEVSLNSSIIFSRTFATEIAGRVAYES